MLVESLKEMIKAAQLSLAAVGNAWQPKGARLHCGTWLFQSTETAPEPPFRPSIPPTAEGLCWSPRGSHHCHLRTRGAEPEEPAAPLPAALPAPCLPPALPLRSVSPNSAGFIPPALPIPLRAVLRRLPLCSRAACAVCSAPLNIRWLLAEVWDGRRLRARSPPAAGPWGLASGAKSLHQPLGQRWSQPGVSPCPEGKQLLLPPPASGLQCLPRRDAAVVLGEARVLSATGSEVLRTGGSGVGAAGVVPQGLSPREAAPTTGGSGVLGPP